MDLAIILAAAEHAAEAAGAGEQHKSEAPFFIAGSVLALYAIVVSVIGFRQPDFPATASAARGVMALGTLLVAAAVSSAVYVAL